MNTKKTLINSCLMSLLAVSGGVYAGTVNDKLNDLHQRMNHLEDSKGESGTNVNIHGLVEVEYGYAEGFDGTDESGITLATFEMVLEATVNDNVDAEIVLLYEDNGDGPLDVDTATISLHNDSSVSFVVGQMYVPFGRFDSFMVSDPLTLDLAETRESAILVNYEANNMSASFYVFNGEIEEGADEDKVSQFGFSLGFENDDFSAGLDYISSISETDGMSEYLLENLDPVDTVIEHVAGLAVHASYTMSDMTVLFEYITALDAYDTTEWIYKGEGAEPSAVNFEFGMGLPGFGNNSAVAVAYQLTDEQLENGAPQTRTMVAFTTELYEATSLGVEFMRETTYQASDGGTDESANAFTVQLATEF